MSYLEPAQIIIPHHSTTYQIDNNAIHYLSSNKVRPSKAEDILELLASNFLYREQESCFYVCKASGEHFSSIGLISKIPTSLIETNIFSHEEISEAKSSKYTACLTKNKIQLNPVILVHQDNQDIENYLEALTINNPPYFQIKSENLLYEFWKSKNIQEAKEAYREIKDFLIADGHHRINSFRQMSGSKFFMAFLISKKNLHSKKLYRKYCNLSNEQKSCSLAFLRHNFGLEEISDTSKEACLHNFLIVCNGKKYLVNQSSCKTSRHEILNFFSQNTDRDLNKNLNFAHFSIDYYYQNNQNDFAAQNGFELIIPEFRIGKDLALEKCHPPHSTWLEPKIPSGLISMLLE